MRLPFLKSKSDAGGAARPAPSADDPGALQAVRTKARRRLIGAVVLLAAAVAGFPLLFETQPRPLPGKAAGTGPSLVIKGDPAPRAAAADTPAAPSAATEPGVSAPAAGTAAGPSAEPAGRVAAAPALALPPVAAVAPVVPASASPGPKPDAAVPDAAAAPAVAASQPAARAAAKDGSAKEAKTQEAKAKETAAKTSADKAAPEKAAAAKAASAALASAKPAATAAAAAATPAGAASAAAAKPPKAAAAEAAASAPAGETAVRWVVQVGAYNDMERMRQARQKAEKLGFKTYITDVDTPTGKRTRVRLGPFATKKEAEAAAAKVKAAGMAANVLSV